MVIKFIGITRPKSYQKAKIKRILGASSLHLGVQRAEESITAAFTTTEKLEKL